MRKEYWLFKSDPDAFGISDLMEKPGQTEPWDGVRNYQARNFLRDAVRVGDCVLFYHSGAAASVVGTAAVVRAGYPDHTAWDPAGRHFDPNSTPEHPVWYMVDIRFETKFPRPVPLSLLKTIPALKQMRLLQRGNRLSIMPVQQHEARIILALAKAQAVRREDAPGAVSPGPA